MRRVALGRANFLFAGSANGGKALAVLYSLVATCEQHRINPQAYLEAAFAETITKDNAADWSPKAWIERATKGPGTDPPPTDESETDAPNDVSQ